MRERQSGGLGQPWSAQQRMESMVGHRESVLFSLILLLIFAAACGGRAETTRASGRPDAGTAAVSGVSANGGATQVALAGRGGAGAPAGSGGRAPIDAGTPIDAGVPVSDAGAPIDAGAIIVGPRPACGSPDADTANSCASLAQLRFENPRFDWTSGGGAEVVVTITNVGPSVVPYPCFGITVDRPTTNLSSSLDANVFALTVGQSGPYTFPLQFAEPVPRGTVLHFTVWVDSLNVGCSDVGEFAFTVVTS